MPLPQSGSTLGRTTLGISMGSLRITVAVTPPRNQPPRDLHSSSTPQPVELPKERAGPSKRSVSAIPFGAPPTIGCRSLHQRARRSSLERKIRLHCHPLGRWQCLNWIQR